jgi:peptidoglycan/xylan/chitin deacetylase (PgdA/CDA1 family)
MMHISISLHSSAHHPLAAFSLHTYYKAVIYAHARFHSISHGYSQNYSSFSGRTVSALIAIAITWWAFVSIHWILWTWFVLCISHLSPNILNALIYCL